MNQRNTQMQDAGGIKQSPLNLAIAKRDGQTLEMVAAAIKHKQTLLDYQPVMMSSDPRQVGFYEGLIRMMDAPGRIIPAKDFIHVIDDTELGRRIDSLSFNMGMQCLFNRPNLRLSINMSARSIGFGPWKLNFYRWLECDETIAERLIFIFASIPAALLVKRTSQVLPPFRLVDVVCRTVARSTLAAVQTSVAPLSSSAGSASQPMFPRMKRALSLDSVC